MKYVFRKVQRPPVPFEFYAFVWTFCNRLWCKFVECQIMMEMAPAVSVEDLFKGRQFDQEIIVLCVRWYWRYKLSTRDLVEMMAERGVVLVPTTILRWVQRYVPEFEKRWNQYAQSVGDSWRCDETYMGC